ncbi:G2/M phase-specific E3 ubiquitin-protein ligase [Chanos chanos]|uniref:G2/M phase-specific E3 ubiquitin-protein ligase n=1 Tax=Chanos chanos TaxID=29144 RepID=A0A6J2WIT3_CHACN|nr:G2/M phase-specific E3 ubiquitin-protein ligase [Chanos chanos]
MSSGVYQRGQDHEGIYGFLVEDIRKEIQRSSRLRCTGCRRTGASVGCFVKSCRQMVHFPCGIQQEFISQFTGTFPSFCREHRPTQTVSISPSLPLSCSVCLEPIEPELSYSVLKCPVCHSSWFHRDCVQHQAYSAALFFFKCTICNNKEQFQQEMLRMGIHIPERDASWELEENAYGELLQVYQQCDAAKCHCSRGRKHSARSGKFEVIRCKYCGSRGTHRRCSNLTLYETSWACADCLSVTEGTVSPLPNHVRSPLSQRQKRKSLIEKCFANRQSGLVTKRHCTLATPAEVLQNLAAQITPQQFTKVSVNQGDVIKAAFAFLRHSDFNPCHALSVTFAGDKSKPGVRSLRRFLRVLVQNLKTLEIFEGPDGHKNLALNSKALREDVYFEVGSLLALCLVHGGPPVGFLSKALYHCLFYFPNQHQLSVDDLADTPFTDKVKRIQEARSVKELREAVLAASEYLEVAGCHRPITCLSDKDMLVEDLINFHLVIRMQLPLQRFREGLRTLGVFEHVQACPEAFFPVFCEPQESLTAQCVARLFAAQHSEEEELKAKEITTIAFWEQYLQECEEGMCATSLDDVLIFATAADAVPAVGFNPTPTLHFLHPAESSSAVPRSQPDANCLSLPVLPAYEIFKKHVEYAVCQLSLLEGV